MSDQSDHDAAISQSINRAMTRARKSLAAANLAPPQLDIVFNVIRDVMNTVLEEVSEDIVREMVARRYHQPDECHVYAKEV